jgi:hypothetical protein
MRGIYLSGYLRIQDEGESSEMGHLEKIFVFEQRAIVHHDQEVCGI